MSAKISRNTFYKYLIYLSLALIIGYLSYTYFLRDIFLNNKTQTIHLTNKTGFELVELKKHDDQKNISSLELEIKGNTKKPITLMLGESPSQMNQQIRIKGGSINFQHVSDWYDPSCFLIIQFENGEKAALDIDYRFIGSGY